MCSDQPHNEPPRPSRRKVLTTAMGAIATLCSTSAPLTSPLNARTKSAPDKAPPEQPSLAALANAKGLILGAAFAVHELDKPYGPAYAQAYTREVNALTSELSFKMSTLRPDAGTLNFAPADRLVAFAAQSGLKLRGHTLVWNDDLPTWIHRLSRSEVAHLFDAHLLSTMERYRGRVWAWDVVNEPIAPWDRLPGNLRKGPFLYALGEDYIARAFRAARHHDSNGLLVLNEAQTETADANGEVFRASLLTLLKRLKAEATPIDAIGLQSHLRSDKTYDMPRFIGFLDEIAALGYAIHITECDVNDRAFSGTAAERDRAVAGLYRTFLKPVLSHPAVKALSFWQLADHTSWLSYAAAQQKGRERRPRPLLLDSDFNRKPAWHAVAEILTDMPLR